jgi:anti-sigma regulatory factor (Ser/Thr protein kinase)
MRREMDRPSLRSATSAAKVHGVTTHSRTLPSVVDSVPAARRFVREALSDLAASAASDDAEVLVSELATNAILHARTEFTVEVSRREDRIRVRVHDLSRLVPRQRFYGADATTGRGIRLVATLSSDWGVDPEGTGKAIWFELPADGATADVPPWDDSEASVDAILASYDEGQADSATNATLAIAA